MSHGLPFGGGRHHFRLLTSFRIAMSSIVSARSFQFGVLVFQGLQRLASDTSMPPNVAFHL
jgi:hypothetical protein